MTRKIALCFFLLFASHAVAAQQFCICTTGCKIASDPFPLNVDPQHDQQPTSCTVKKAGVTVATGVPVLSNTIPTSNVSVCSPASSIYIPGPAGSVACLVTIPAQPAGNVTLTMTASNPAGTTADSAPLSFTSVAALPVLPSVPANIRAN